jgi:hypothetical protein
VGDVVDFLDKQIAPPRNWETFEDLCRALFAAVFKNPLASKNGRRGQPQHGVDVSVELLDQPGSWAGIQCKGKDLGYGSMATKAEFDAELVKAEKFQPKLSRWISSPPRPTTPSFKSMRERSTRRGWLPGSFRSNSWVGIAAGADLAARSRHPAILPRARPGGTG